VKLAAVLAAAMVAAFPAAADLLMPSTLDLGAISGTQKVTRTFTVKNSGSEALAVSLLPACDCLTLEPSSVKLPAGGSQEVRLTFDPADSSGAVSKLVLARVEGALGLDRLLTVTGTVAAPGGAGASGAEECEWCRKLSAEAQQQVAISDALARGVLYYYYSPDCPSCTLFLIEELPKLEERLGREIEVRPRDIRDPGVLDELDRLLSWHQMKLTALPVLVAAGGVLEGDQAIRSGLQTLIGKGKRP
jgi:hypothetical protein